MLPLQVDGRLYQMTIEVQSHLNTMQLFVRKQKHLTMHAIQVTTTITQTDDTFNAICKH